VKFRRSNCAYENAGECFAERRQGLGEGGACGAPAVVLNAVNDALCAVRRLDRRNSSNAAADSRAGRMGPMD
jgi:hypothetical protein